MIEEEYAPLDRLAGRRICKFMLWATDGAPDTLRIKIWWEDDAGVENDVYDNGFDQAIGGGSIIVHD